jgi:hypothetical protein
LVSGPIDKPFGGTPRANHQDGRESFREVSAYSTVCRGLAQGAARNRRRRRLKMAFDRISRWFRKT